jgi:septal ring factor EnvC (AmiA/AmiB activator)
MNDQLDKLESSVARLVQAYNEMKAENAALKAQLADKTAAVELLEEEAAAVRSRIDSLIVSLTADQQMEQPSA